MASFVEASVEVILRVERNDEGQARVYAIAQSRSADGTLMRATRRDITDQLSDARRTGAANLLSEVEAAFRAQWNIP